MATCAWTVRTFAGANESPSPAQASTTLVRTGPFAHSRNPLYLGTVIAALGGAISLGSPVGAAYGGLLWAVYHLLVVYREEPALERTFGDDFRRYRQEAPRWL